MLKILIVEDETNLGQTLLDFLNSEGHSAHWATNAMSARKQYLHIFPDVLLLDIGLPDGNGIDLARDIRNENKNAVIIFLSAINDPDTKVLGLEIGAEDYITKPFALKELTLRLKKIFNTKITLASLPDEIIHGPLKIAFKKYEVTDALGEKIALSQKECGILELLYSKKNEAVARDEIIEKIWGEDKFPSNRTVDNYIVKLRKWCETDLNKHLEIQSIRGIGYKLIVLNKGI